MIKIRTVKRKNVKRALLHKDPDSPEHIQDREENARLLRKKSGHMPNYDAGAASQKNEKNPYEKYQCVLEMCPDRAYLREDRRDFLKEYYDKTLEHSYGKPKHAKVKNPKRKPLDQVARTVTVNPSTESQSLIQLEVERTRKNYVKNYKEFYESQKELEEDAKNEAQKILYREIQLVKQELCDKNILNGNYDMVGAVHADSGRIHFEFVQRVKAEKDIDSERVKLPTIRGRTCGPSMTTKELKDMPAKVRRKAESAIDRLVNTAVEERIGREYSRDITRDRVEARERDLHDKSVFKSKKYTRNRDRDIAKERAKRTLEREVGR